VVFLLFFLHREFFISNSKVAFFLKFIGMRTFDIYLLHWFFLPNKSALAQLSTLNGTFLFQAMNCFIISIIVILFCIIISQIVRISPILSSWIFGVKYRK
jgi:peptidoglycan/LPS O-acetylase OafA/YrhL